MQVWHLGVGRLTFLISAGNEPWIHVTSAVTASSRSMIVLWIHRRDGDMDTWVAILVADGGSRADEGWSSDCGIWKHNVQPTNQEELSERKKRLRSLSVTFNFNSTFCSVTNHKERLHALCCSGCLGNLIVIRYVWFPLQKVNDLSGRITVFMQIIRSSHFFLFSPLPCLIPPRLVFRDIWQQMQNKTHRVTWKWSAL